MKKLCVITGGSHGIGKATAQHFLSHNYEVISLSRTQPNLMGITHVSADLSTEQWEDSVRDYFNHLFNKSMEICLVHNAAQYEADNVKTLSSHLLKKVLQTNLISALTLNQILLPFMAKGSSILYIGSTLSEQAVPNRASYVISKHAVAGLMRATCQDLAGTEITTACICPGFVNTSMLTNQVPDDILQNFIKEKVTQQRLIEPQEMAEFIYFCATHPITNGAVLHANLGQVNN